MIQTKKIDIHVHLTGAIVPSLTHTPGYQTMITLVYMVKAVQMSNTKPAIHDTSLSSDLYTLQFWYKQILRMTVMDSHQYRQFVRTVKEVSFLSEIEMVILNDYINLNTRLT